MVGRAEVEGLVKVEVSKAPEAKAEAKAVAARAVAAAAVEPMAVGAVTAAPADLVLGCAEVKQAAAGRGWGAEVRVLEAAARARGEMVVARASMAGVRVVEPAAATVAVATARVEPQAVALAAALPGWEALAGASPPNSSQCSHS